MTSLSASLLLLGLTLTPSAAADVAAADVATADGATRVDTVDPSAPDGVLPDDSQPWHALTETPSGLRIHAVRTGWVRVKKPHREFGGPAALRLPAVLASGTWADWMPIISYAVEHPEGIVLVDTGMDPGLNDVDHFGEDKRNGWFYRKNLRFFLGRGGWLGDRLQALDLDPARVSDVVITHFHADHVGGFPALPTVLSGQAPVHVGPGNWPGHMGAFTGQLPEGFAPSIIEWQAGAGAFAQSLPLTPDGRVRVVPLPGHTPGHVGLLVEDGGQRWLMVGDATFDLEQTARGGIAGVSEHPNDAEATQELLQRLVEEGVTVLPAHDANVFQRL